MVLTEQVLMLVAMPCALACPLCIIFGFLSQEPTLALWGFGAGVVANAITFTVLLLEGRLGAASISAVLAAGCALGWWEMWRRRRRDRAPKMLGYKARAAIAALVAKVRESARPRPVLRPAPGGAL